MLRKYIAKPYLGRKIRNEHIRVSDAHSVLYGLSIALFL